MLTAGIAPAAHQAAEPGPHLAPSFQQKLNRSNYSIERPIYK